LAESLINYPDEGKAWSSTREFPSIIIKIMNSFHYSRTIHPNRKGKVWCEEVAQPSKWWSVPSQRRARLPSRHATTEVRRQKANAFLPSITTVSTTKQGVLEKSGG